MARKTTRQGLKAAKKGKAAAVKKPKEQAKADARALHGEVKPLNAAEIDEVFRRFHAANPVPKGELPHINPYTLLVAVVLSAQATDAGVNKATPALFAAADTPEKMVEARRSQGARFRQDHRALSRQGEEHHFIVEDTHRRARQPGAAHARGAGSIARRRTQDRERGAQYRLRRADHRGRHACVPRRQPHRDWRSGKIRSRSRRGSAK